MATAEIHVSIDVSAAPFLWVNRIRLFGISNKNKNRKKL